ILDPDSLKDNNIYRLEFNDFSAFHDNPKPWYRLINKTSGDTVISLRQLKSDQEQTAVVHGFVVNINNDPLVSIDRDKTGWATGKSNYVVQVGFDSRYAGAYVGRRV